MAGLSGDFSHRLLKIVCLFAICAGAWGQSGVARPQLGKMLDASGAVRTVYGIAASVTLGDAETTGVLSAACSKNYCLAKTDASIVSPTGAVDAPPGPVLFAFDSDVAYVWFPRSRQLATWNSDRLTFLDSNIDGEVLSIGVSAGGVQFAVRRFKGDVWIVNQDGSAAGALPHGTGAVMLIPGGVVYAEHGEIVIGSTRFPLRGVTGFSQMSASYLQVRAGGLDYSLRIDQGREMLFQLPGVAQ
jgi:hypothetical protein